MKKAITIVAVCLLSLTLTGSMAIVVREAPKLSEMRLVEIGGCKVESSSKTPALIKLLPSC